jgi:hypothetical protein
MIIRHKSTFIALLLTFAASLTGAAQSGAAGKDWSIDSSMYMLGAGMSGNATVRGVPVDVDIPFSEIWSNLQFGAMGRITARKNKWCFSTDVIYMGLGAVKNNIDLGYDQWLVQPVVEYQATPWLSPYAGARFLSMEADLRGPLGRTRSGQQSWWDPVVGAELRLPATSRIRLRVRGDVGGFGAGSAFSGQIEPTMDWRVSKRMSLQFGWRWLYADYKNGSGRDLFVYDLLTTGPQLGATFHF